MSTNQRRLGRLATFALLSVASVLQIGNASAENEAEFVAPKEFRIIRYPEYGGGPIHEYLAPKFEDQEMLHESSHHRIIWTLSRPPTTATKTAVAGLFLLVSHEGTWKVSDAKRFEAAGKDSGAKAAMTNSSRAEPHLTVTLYHGGRGHFYEQSVSFKVEQDIFKLDLPTEKPIRKSEISNFTTKPHH